MRTDLYTLSLPPGATMNRNSWFCNGREGGLTSMCGKATQPNNIDPAQNNGETLSMLSGCCCRISD
jgi:hypothetical protein